MVWHLDLLLVVKVSVEQPPNDTSLACKLGELGFDFAVYFESMNSDGFGRVFDVRGGDSWRWERCNSVQNEGNNVVQGSVPLHSWQPLLHSWSVAR